MDEPARSKLLSEVTKEHNFDGLLNNVGLVTQLLWKKSPWSSSTHVLT